MTTNNKPATALPWTFEQHNGTKPEKYLGRPAYQPADVSGRGGKRVCSFHHMPNDAAYIVHTANAYPRLVEALRDAELRLFVAGQRRESDGNLLRDLGEEIMSGYDTDDEAFMAELACWKERHHA